jgi:homotetrameric cytidine deaminase
MASRRNVECKAADPDPQATLRAALAYGAQERGVLDQRDTYFSAPQGLLKVREERAEDGGATRAQLVSYARAHEAVAGTSAYHLVDVPDPAALIAALDATLGTVVVVHKRRRLLLWQEVRIHLDEVEGLGRWIELEAVAPPESDLSTEHARVAELREVLGMADERVVAGGYAALALDAGAATDRLVGLARRAMSRAHAPYSNFRVGAALRDDRGGLHAGTNVENASYPEGQCAETSAIGALVAAGGRQIREVVVMADTELITPCGGCRQRLGELAEPGVAVHLCGPEGVRRSTTVGELLPFAFAEHDLPAA